MYLKTLFISLIFLISVNITATNENLENDIFLNEISNKIPTIEYRNSAKILVLNKVTSLSKEVIINVGEAKYFGNIEIKLYKCAVSLDIYKPNNLMLLSVTEHNIDDENIDIFNGWLMSQNFSISSLEHPIYEIFARECL
jgi:hypothetical protein